MDQERPVQDEINSLDRPQSFLKVTAERENAKPITSKSNVIIPHSVDEEDKTERKVFEPIVDATTLHETVISTDPRERLGKCLADNTIRSNLSGVKLFVKHSIKTVRERPELAQFSRFV